MQEPLKGEKKARKQKTSAEKLEIRKATFYNGKNRYGGIEASDVKRLNALEEENARLKRCLPTYA